MAAKKTQDASTMPNPDRVFDWVDKDCANAPVNGYTPAGIPYTPSIGTCDCCQGKNVERHPVVRPEHAPDAS